MELSEPVRQIVTKATMFDPDKRYQTTEELLPDLLKARYPSVFSSQPIPIAVPSFRKHSRSRLPYFLLFLFTAGAGLAAGWRLSGKISLPETIFQKEDSYTFTEPLIEEAVRSMLNKPEGLLTLSDLEKVTELHIFGLQIFPLTANFSPSEVPSGFTMKPRGTQNSTNSAEPSLLWKISPICQTSPS
ncbi:MAG: hypothetical protein ACLR2E_21560 [Lachnospiraceae bacterium]